MSSWTARLPLVFVARRLPVEEAPRAGAPAAALPADAASFASGARWVALYWTAVFAIDLLNDWLIPGLADGRRPLSLAARESAIWWSGWIVLTPAILIVSQRAARLTPWRAALAWSILACVVVPAHTLGTAFLFTAGRPDVIATPELAALFAVQFTLPQAFTLAGLLLTWHLSQTRRVARAAAVRARASELRAQHADRLEAEASLAGLRREHDVHLLLNALNAAAGEIRGGRSTEAVTMLARLGDLVRESAGEAGATGVPLARELELLDRYIAVENMRYGGSLVVRCDVEPSVRRALVPPLLLQPLVENAIRHGIACDGVAPIVHLSARRHEGALCIDVRNPAWAPVEEPLREGRGLSVVRRRLERTCGGDASLVVQRVPGGVVARVRIPLRRAESRREDP